MSDPTQSALTQQVAEATKTAMKARDKTRVAALRLIAAEFKRVEVDERRTLSDDDVLTILNRMLKQRRDSLSQYEQAGRAELAAQEQVEIDIINEFMPEQLSAEAVDAAVVEAIAATGAAGMKDMGKVMGLLTPKLKGRADMGAVSAVVKSRLGA